jgi:thiamine-phosphate pyrophosphorylase
MQLVVISHPDAVTNEARIINQLFEAGLTRFHLRKPGYDANQIAGLLKQIDEQYRHYIALHQHHAIAKDFGLERLHYTEQHRESTGVEKLASQNHQGYILSTSVHDLSVLPCLKWFDNAFFSPVFNSISKLGYETELPAGFTLNKNDIDLKIIALGGVQVSNINKVKAMNFDGAAVLGAIWNNPEQAIANFKNLQ